MKAAIFILTQNNEVRRTYLKTSLYFLFRHFNAKFKYPVVILHEGDYDAIAQREILMSIRDSCRDLVSFVHLDPDDFVIPDHIDKKKMANCIATKPVPYWRNEKYRLMCRWWMVHFHKYAKGYDYVMRLDDDSIIEEPIENDLFQWMADNDLIYSSNLVHVDCGICCHDMKEFFEDLDPSKKDMISKIFVPSEMPNNHVMAGFRSLLSITQGSKASDYVSGEKLKIWMPTMYYNNFFITQTAFWRQDTVQKTIDAIDKHGGIFYYRWGDAPLQSIIVLLHSDDSKRIKRALFKYSKRLQREAFKDDNDEFHSYMPQSYEESSCIAASAI